MAYLNKEAYFYKNEWAAKHQAEQKENCNTLTEEQHDVIAWLCGVRHFIHTHMDAYYNSEHSDHDKVYNYIYDDSCGINAELARVGLSTIQWAVDGLDTISDFDYYEGLTDYEDSEAASEAAYDQISTLHDQIESYLYNIDKEHCTQYAPTGATRLY